MPFDRYASQLEQQQIDNEKEVTALTRILDSRVVTDADVWVVVRVLTRLQSKGIQLERQLLQHCENNRNQGIKY